LLTALLFVDRAFAHNTSTNPEEPESCALVFETAAEAAAHCEADSYPVPVKDLWNNLVVGYSCYCPGQSPIASPVSEALR